MQPVGGVEQANDRSLTPRVAAITMARDERDMLPRWIAYYGDQLGTDNLVVLDDNSVDGSTENLPCTVFRLPVEPWKRPWGKARAALANGISRGLLFCYDVVLFTDVDEFLVPDPARHGGLIDYLADRSGQEVIAPLAVNLLHNARIEAPIDHSQSVLRQRRFVKFAPSMCKPLVKRITADWYHAFHGIKAPFEIDRELLMLHLKYYDVDALQTVADQRRDVYDAKGRGSGLSAWPLGSNELTSRLQRWVEAPVDGVVPEFDPREPDVTKVIHRVDAESFQSRGLQLVAMEESPLRRLPTRFQDLL